MGHIFFCLCYAAMTWFTVNAWFRLRDLRRRIDSVHGTQRMLFAIAIDGNIQEHQQQLARLKQQLQELIDNECFEDAERLQQHINELERFIADQVEYIRTEFDECEVKFYDVNSREGDEV